MFQRLNISLILSIFTLTTFAQMDSLIIPLEPPDPGTKGGITFIRTTMIDTLKDFYLNEVGCELWLDQGGCAIFQHGNQLFGFCEAAEAELEGLLTFFYTNTKMVDYMYGKLNHLADTPPMKNPKYRIYHFYAHDPEGRRIEFQVFLHDIPEIR
jgi:hypothetical protein